MTDLTPKVAAMNPAHTRYARRMLAAEIASDRGQTADEQPDLVAACFAGKHDKDPRFPALLKAAKRQFGSPSAHANDALRRNGKREAAMRTRMVR